MYQPVLPSSDPVPPSTDRYCLLLNQYHHISTSTAPYWPSTTKYQSIPTYTDPVPSYMNQYHLLLTQYHQVPTAAAFYWPSVIIYQPVPLLTDPVPPSIPQYQPIRLLLGDYRLLHSLPLVLLTLYCQVLSNSSSKLWNPSFSFTAMNIASIISSRSSSCSKSVYWIE